MANIDNISSKIHVGFRIVCFVSALALTSYWTYIFILDEDLCTVDYKKYYAEKSDAFPVLSFCINNPVSKKKLERANPNINISSYLNYLKGQAFNSNILDIEYSSVIQNASDFIEEDFVRYRNGSFVSLWSGYQDDETYGKSTLNTKNRRTFSADYAFFFISRFYNCYELSVPDDRNIYSFFFRINSSIFPSGIRGSFFDLLTVLHYPSQMLIAGNRRYYWPKERNNEESYIMKYHIQRVEVLKRRQARNRPCNENWKNHDNEIENKFTNALDCRLPYLHRNNEFPICTSKKKLQERFYLRSDDYGVNPPCLEMKKITDLFEESTLDSKKYSWARKGSFIIGIIFPDEDYKEITQTR